MEVLAVVLFAVGDDRLRLAELREHHDDLATLDLLHLTREQLADLVGELLADPGPLAFAHALNDALLRRLHRRAPERLEGHFLLQHVADLEVRVLEARFLERHLRAGVLHGLDHGAQHDDPDRPLQLVDADLGPHVGAVALHQGRVQPVLQQVEQLRALPTVASSGTATIRARTRPSPATVARTSWPTKRTQWRCQRSGRSSPGLETSSA